MPLSPDEQRVLDALERDLDSDPRLGRTMKRQPRQRGRMVFAVLGVIAGLGVILAGVMTQLVILGIVGFALMIGAAMWAIFAPKSPSPTGRPGARPNAGPKEPFTRRFEQRLDRRREQGDL